VYRSTVRTCIIRPANVLKRLSFARRHLRSNRTNWVFIDALKLYVNVFGRRDRRFFWQRPGLRKPQGILQNARTFFFYSAVSTQGKMPLLFITQRPFTSSVFCSEVLTVVKRWADGLHGAGSWRLGMDFATIHVSKYTSRFCSQRNIKLIEGYPPQAQDINCIENCWSALKANLQSMKFANTSDATKAAVVRSWEEVSMQFVNNCFSSLDNRLRLIIEGKGKLLQGY
jgi:hypothetical protein